MNKETFFHKMNREYIYAIEKNKYVIKVRTKKEDCKKISICFCDKYANVSKDNNEYRSEMKKVASDNLFDYYEGIVESDSLVVKYYFEIDDGVETTFYGNYDFFHNRIDNNMYKFDIPKNSRNSEQHRKIDWLSEGVVYQIFPDRFNTGINNQPKTDWNKRGH